VKRWSAALAWISLALAGIAAAEPARSVDLPVSVPVDIALPGLDQAVAADPSIVRVDADLHRGVLVLTGILLNRQSVVYAWTTAGMTVFIARVVAPPASPTPEHQRQLVPAGRGSLYRVSLGSGFRTNQSGTRRLPFAFGASAARLAGPGRLTLRSETRPFAGDNPSEAPQGTATVRWANDRGHVALGDQPVELGPQLLATFPLRGLAAEAALGDATVGAFAGMRASPEFTLDPDEHDPLPGYLGGLRASWALSKALRASGVLAVTDARPAADLALEWHDAGWLLALEGAGTADRRGIGVRLRRETADLTLEQRLTHRTSTQTALLPGLAGLVSESLGTYRITPTLALAAAISTLPPLERVGWDGGWRVGAQYSGIAGVRLALGFDRTFDGSLSSVSGAVDTHSKVFGTASLTVSRTEQDYETGTSVVWHEAGRMERHIALGPVSKLFAEEVVSVTGVGASVNVLAGVEAEIGWVRASVAPGAIVPTLTDPNGAAPTLRLRIQAAPSQAFQVHADVLKTWGERPDLTAQMGVSVGFGSAAPWGPVGSWFRRSSIEGVVFVDQNGNGRPDADEPGLAGVPVRVDGGESVVTGSDGRYRISGLPDGRYAVSLDRSRLPADLRLASASPVQVTLPAERGDVVFAFAGSGAIHGVVFNDLLQSGRFSGTEPGVAANVMIEGPQTRRALSVAGAFSVTGLAPGRYHLTLDALSLPPAYAVRRPSVEVEIGTGGVATVQFPVLALRALEVTACLARRNGGECGEGDVPAAGLRLLVGAALVSLDAQGRGFVRELPAGRISLAVDPASVPAGFTVPRPMTLDLAEGPTTLPVAIRLVPASR